MKYCIHCGKEMLDEALICENCNTPVATVQPVQTPAEPVAVEPVKVEAPDKEVKASKGWLFLGIGLPIVALVLFFILRRKKPAIAKRLKKGMIIGFIVYTVYYILEFVLIPILSYVFSGVMAIIAYLLSGVLTVISYVVAGIIAIIGALASSVLAPIFGSVVDSIMESIIAAVSNGISAAMTEIFSSFNVSIGSISLDIPSIIEELIGLITSLI